MVESSEHVVGEAGKDARAASAAFFSELRGVTFQQISEGYKWVSAALLTINSGGALLSVNNATAGKSVLPAFAFGAGLLCVIVGVVFVREASYASIHKTLELEMALRSGGDIGDDAEIPSWPFVVSKVLEYISLALFVIGAYIMASEAHDEPNSRRCQALQQDMLSAVPKRSDSTVVFQALGCRPQGEGSVHAPPIRR